MSRKSILLTLALVLGVGAFWWWYKQRNPSGYRPALSSREIATRVLAEYLVQVSPHSKALVIGNPFTLRRGQAPEIYAFERAAIGGLQQGFGTPDRVKVVHPELRPEFLQQPESVWVDPKTTTPLSFLVAENAFDQLIQQNPDYELIVSLIGLPVNLRECRFWQQNGRPSVALLLPDWRMIGSAEAVREAFRSGKLVAAVMSKPGAPTEEPAKGSPDRAEFDLRFWLVTKDNIDELVTSHPKLF